MCPNLSSKDLFLEFSATFTGYSRAKLESTGLTEVYYNVINTIIDCEILGELWLEFEKIDDKHNTENNDAYQHLLTDTKFGPVIKNIITLWYLGQWNQMPSHWRNQFGATAQDRDHIISAQSYKQGLVWQAMGAHPMGTKQQGFGSWSLPPAKRTRITDTRQYHGKSKKNETGPARV